MDTQQQQSWPLFYLICMIRIRAVTYNPPIAASGAYCSTNLNLSAFQVINFSDSPELWTFCEKAARTTRNELRKDDKTPRTCERFITAPLSTPINMKPNSVSCTKKGRPPTVFVHVEYKPVCQHLTTPFPASRCGLHVGTCTGAA